jgi:3-oxoadipate enol-lactonase
MPYARVRGIDLFFEEHGAGPHVVVAHGALGSTHFANTFGLKASTLAARGLHVIAFDARGHGRSGYTRRATDYDKQALADDLLSLMDALGLERASICGTSMGATTALLLALGHPERVESLVVRAPAPFAADIAAARRMMHALTLSYQVLGVSLTARLVSMLPGVDAAERRRALLRGQRRGAIVPALRGFLSEPLSMDRLDAIAARTLVMAHAGDPLHPLRSGEVLHDRLPHADLLVAPSPTFWHDRDDDLAALIAAFVTGDDGSLADCPSVRACTLSRRQR